MLTFMTDNNQFSYDILASSHADARPSLALSPYGSSVLASMFSRSITLSPYGFIALSLR